MGLVKEGDEYIVLTDIAGVEDHLGDMDFKVAGTREGITALQMDIKIKGVTPAIMRDALEQARHARLAILDKMSEAIASPRTELKEFAPRIITVKVDSDKIGAVIGKGGETIRGLEAEYEVTIEIDDDGVAKIFATDGRMGEACAESIRSIVKNIEPGEVIVGRVVSTTNFGAFVNLKPGTDGLVHISKLGAGRRVETVEEIVEKGDVVKVEVLDVAIQNGKEKISLRLLEKLDQNA
jgi:polyribonucleotide nucleotidyltransferase